MASLSPACGSCSHCDQLHDGFYRLCEVRKEKVYALGKVCEYYDDVWEKDLFGTFKYERMKAEGKAK